MTFPTDTLSTRGFVPTAALIAILTAILPLLSLSGCSAMGTWVEASRGDYRSAKSAPALVIPSDLTPVVPRFNEPSPVSARSAGAPNPSDLAQASVHLSVKCTEDALCELTVYDRAPEQLWPHVREFWLQLGFTLAQERPDIGLIETNWAENRAKIPHDWLRHKLGALGDYLYSSGTRDQFRMLVERGQNNATFISITHHGMEEVLTGREQVSTRWQARAREPELEHLILIRLLESFGLSPEQAQQRMAEARQPPAAASPSAQ